MEFLRVSGRHIVNAKGKQVRLRGTCPGGWMNMEDFINGYPGAEHTLRAQMAEVLGPARAQFFFERMLDYFFNEDDVIFLRKTGASVVRIPLNYRHFEDDAAPFKYTEAGFARLDKVLSHCERHGLYVILDLHSAQGWQNVHWHSDNAARISLFWEVAFYQDRFVALWKEFARRYKNRAVLRTGIWQNRSATSSMPRGRSSPSSITFRCGLASLGLSLTGLPMRVVTAFAL
jgi:endoglucanase